jgi:hypothetical protein
VSTVNPETVLLTIPATTPLLVIDINLIGAGVTKNAFARIKKTFVFNINKSAINEDIEKQIRTHDLISVSAAIENDNAVLKLNTIPGVEMSWKGKAEVYEL